MKVYCATVHSPRRMEVDDGVYSCAVCGFRRTALDVNQAIEDAQPDQLLELGQHGLLTYFDQDALPELTEDLQPAFFVGGPAHAMNALVPRHEDQRAVWIGSTPHLYVRSEIEDVFVEVTS